MSSQNPVWTPQPQGFYSEETTFQPSASNHEASPSEIKLTGGEQRALKELENKMSHLVNSLRASENIFKQLYTEVTKLSDKETMKRSHFKHGLHAINEKVIKHMGETLPTILANFAGFHTGIFHILSPLVGGLNDATVENLKTNENVLFGKEMGSLAAESSQQTSHLQSMAHLKIKMFQENDNLLRKMESARAQFNTLEEQHNKQLATIREQQQNTAKMYKNIAGNFMDLFAGHKQVWTSFVKELETLMKNQEKLDHKALTSLVAQHINKLNTLSKIANPD